MSLTDNTNLLKQVNFFTGPNILHQLLWIIIPFRGNVYSPSSTNAIPELGLGNNTNETRHLCPVQ